jgi:zinc D-Ala-D-Ala dipeptidase
MSLQKITEQTHSVLIDMRYATENNFTKQVIYKDSECFLHEKAVDLLEKAIVLADQQRYRIKILDAWRPQSAQEFLWSICPDATFIAPPEKGSAHTRGVALDLTLTDVEGNELPMGTPFDSFTPRSFHGAVDLDRESAHNRYQLLGIMMSAGWDLFANEWWHYQLFNAREYPLIKDSISLSENAA